MSKNKPVKPVGREKGTVGKAKVATGRTVIPVEPPYPVESANDPFLKKIFWAGTLVIGLIMLIGASNSGINADDWYQNDYSKKLVNYYTSMGQDTSAYYIPNGNMHLYGGFFDVVTGFINKGLGYTDQDLMYHTIRHWLIALLGLVTLICTALFAKEFAGWRAAILTMLALALSPRFLGESFMNPKDIPFAAGNMMAIYGMVLLFKEMPRPRWSVVALMAGGIALAVSTRAGGLLLYAYIGLFGLLHFIKQLKEKGNPGFGTLFSKYALYIGGAMIAGYIMAILFWPFALHAPFSNPLKALSEFSNLGTKIRVLFKGENVMSDQTDWDYPLQWIFRTIPLFTVGGFLLGMALLPVIWKRFRTMPVGIAYFTAIFPVAYIIYKDSILHDGWRHLTFVYPPMVLVAVLAWTKIEEYIKNNKTALYALYAVIGLSLAEPALFIAKNFSYPYLYFNPLNGGLKGAYGEFETDYWGVGVKQAVQWMEKEGILNKNMKDSITVISSFMYNVETYAKSKGYKANIGYLKYDNRNDYPWDYAIFPSRFIEGSYLRNGSYPPKSNAIHTIYANGVPIVTILKDTEQLGYKGFEAMKNRDWNGAITAYSAETGKHPDNEVAWMGLANANLNAFLTAGAVNDTANTKTHLQGLKNAAEKILGLNPADETAKVYIGLQKMYSNDLPGAKTDFENIIAGNKDYPQAYYYLALIQSNMNDNAAAAENIKACIKLNPGFRPAYELGYQVYTRIGDTNSAQMFQQALQQLK